MLPQDTFRNKTVLITGGGTGLGKSIGTKLSSLGANLIIASRKKEVIEKAAAEISGSTGNSVLWVPTDIRDYDQVINMVDQGIQEFGNIDILVNNAAGNFISPTERLSPKAFKTIIDIVLNGSVNCTLELGKRWIIQKNAGVVLSIVTTYSWTGSGFVVPSATAKAGVLALTRSLAVEWAKYGIRLNAIAPGSFPTPGAWTRLFPEEIASFIDPVKRIPLQRFGEHEELANLASYLVSDYASFINGEVVTIDGGEWLKGAGQFNDLDKIPNNLWDIIENVTRSMGKANKESTED